MQCGEQAGAHTNHGTHTPPPPAHPPTPAPAPLSRPLISYRDAIRGGSVQSPSTHHALKKLSLFMPFHPVKKLAFDVAAGASRR